MRRTYMATVIGVDVNRLSITIVTKSRTNDTSIYPARELV